MYAGTKTAFVLILTTPCVNITRAITVNLPGTMLGTQAISCPSASTTGSSSYHVYLTRTDGDYPENRAVPGSWNNIDMGNGWKLIVVPTLTFGPWPTFQQASAPWPHTLSRAPYGPNSAGGNVYRYTAETKWTCATVTAQRSLGFFRGTVTYDWVRSPTITGRPTLTLFLCSSGKCIPLSSGAPTDPIPAPETACSVTNSPTTINLGTLQTGVAAGATGTKPFSVTCDMPATASVSLTGCTPWDINGFCQVSLSSNGGSGTLVLKDPANGVWKSNATVKLNSGVTDANIEYDFSQTVASTPGHVSASVVVTIAYQ